MTAAADQRFELCGILGRGARSIVYDAIDRQSDQKIALKLAQGSDALRRFERQVALSRQLRAPGTVRACDAGLRRGDAFLAMQRIDGVTLQQILKQGRLELRRALLLAIGLCDALVALHAAGWVHRDVKPANLLVDASDRLTLIDLDLAVPFGHAADAASYLGTPAYMSPEMLRGATLDGKADIFAAGAILYAMLTGTRPFGGSAADITEAACSRDPAPPSSLVPSLPRALDALVLSALARDAAHRPDATELRRALQQI